MKNTIPESIAIFLADKGYDIEDVFIGRISAADQRKYFGVFMGRGTIVVNGATDTVTRRVTCGYGAYYLNIAQINGRNMSYSYYDITRDFHVPKEYQTFLERVGGRVTENQMEYEV